MYLKHSDLKYFRQKVLEKQNYLCPLCGEEIKESDAVLDHDHGTGYIRQVLHRNCNSMEGMILHKFKRSGVHKLTDIFTYLKNLLDYWDNDYTRNLKHPSEKPKEPKIGKREFNKIAKYYKITYPNRKPLEYPKSKKWTKLLKELKEEMDG